jgi:hypothetical protein
MQTRISGSQRERERERERGVGGEDLLANEKIIGEIP